MTHDEALALALDWAEGRKSHWNEMLTAEVDFSRRPQTLAAISQADAYEVVRWSALASALAGVAVPETDPPKQDLGGDEVASSAGEA